MTMTSRQMTQDLTHPNHTLKEVEAKIELLEHLHGKPTLVVNRELEQLKLEVNKLYTAIDAVSMMYANVDHGYKTRLQFWNICDEITETFEAPAIRTQELAYRWQIWYEQLTELVFDYEPEHKCNYLKGMADYLISSIEVPDFKTGHVSQQMFLNTYTAANTCKKSIKYGKPSSCDGKRGENRVAVRQPTVNDKL